MGVVSAAVALLLPKSDQVRFVPALNSTGSASLVFDGWDGSQGKASTLASSLLTGGTSAFSLAPARANWRRKDGRAHSLQCDNDNGDMPGQYLSRS